MLDSTITLIYLLVFASGFTLAGMWYSRSSRENLEDYLVARNSQSATATILTLLATSLGAWILFAPAQAATWGGLSAVIGYALGAIAPRLAMIPLGKRMREVMPQGHTLTEFIMHRYGRPMYRLILIIMLFYMFITLTAEITAIAKLIALIAPIPLWTTATIVMGSTLLYTSFGGLRATIFTDKVQMIVIAPLLLILLYFGWLAVGGLSPVLDGLHQRAPQLLQLSNPVGIKAGLTFFVAILLTGLFHQGNWQRIYSARDTPTMRVGFSFAGLLAGPIIFIMGIFGLAFVGLGHSADTSVALFTVIMPGLPVWFCIALIPLGLSLVMSSADTAINAVSSLVAVDLRRRYPDMQQARVMTWSRLLIFVLTIPALIVAAQGYSVLYLFLLADLFCAAATFPVFFGLFSRRYSGLIAIFSTLSGLAAGIALFPAPGAALDYLLESFLLAALLPLAVSAILMLCLPARTHFDFDTLKTAIRGLNT